MVIQSAIDFEKREATQQSAPAQISPSITLHEDDPISKFKAGKRIELSDIKSQIDAVLYHIQQEGYITSLDGFKDWGITRLSSIIHKLRHIYLIDIESEDVSEENRFKNTITFSKYKLRETSNSI